MKKISIVIAIIAIVFCFSGCSHENEEVQEIEDILYDMNIQIDDIKSNTYDPIFWSSAERVTNLISGTLEQYKSVEVDYRLQIGDKTKIITGFSTCLVVDNYTYRQLSAAELLFSLATSDEIMNAHVAGQPVEVTGVIIIWQDRKNWYSKEMIDFSACELDSEDGWDYACRGRLEFFGMPHVISVEYEVKGVDINQLAFADEATTLSELRRATF